MQNSLRLNWIYRFSQKISVLLHPLLMPTYGVLLLFFSYKIPGFSRWNYGKDLWDAYLFIFWCFIFTFLSPSLFAYILKKIGFISSLGMEDKRERTYPFLFTGLMYVLFYVFSDNLTDFKAPIVVNMFILGAVISILLASVISLSWKISAHMIGIGGLCGMFYVLNVWSSVLFSHLIICILLAGIVGFARLYLKAHTLLQVLLGFLLGFFSISIYVFIW